MDEDSYTGTSSNEQHSESEDSYTEITSESWFKRLGNAFMGLLFGLILMIIGFPLLFWNEGRAVATYKALKEGAGTVISIPATPINKVNEGKLVHLSGLATTQDILKDPAFGIAAQAIKLERQAQMYQWKENKKSETEKNLGGGTTTKTTYTYEKVWSDQVINSNDYKKPGHVNPSTMAYAPQTFKAAKVSLGAFLLPPWLIDQISTSEPLAIDPRFLLISDLRNRILIEDNILYLGRNRQYPEIGDLKIEFRIVKPQTVSIVAKQINNTFEPYLTTSGKSIELLEVGAKSAENMFQHAQQENKITTWVLRCVGFLVISLGLVLILRPLSVALDVLPILGDVAGAGIGLISFLLGLILSLITVAVAWFFYRPLIAVVLLVVAGLLGFSLKKLKQPRAATT